MATAVEEDKPGLTNFNLERLTAWLGLAAAIGGPLYVLGLLVLSLQLRETHRIDWGAAWYAASLASNKLILAVCLGQVRRQGLALLFAVGLSFFFVWSAPRSLPRDESRRSHDTGRGGRLCFAKLILDATLVVASIALVGLMLYRSQNAQQALLLFATLALGIIVGGFAAYEAARKRAFLIIAAEIMVAMSIALMLTALINADLGKPPLPAIELPLANGTVVRGGLIDHSGGYWHILTSSDGALVANKDNEAKPVTSRPNLSVPSLTCSP